MQSMWSVTVITFANERQNLFRSSIVLKDRSEAQLQASIEEVADGGKAICGFIFRLSCVDNAGDYVQLRWALLGQALVNLERQ